MNAENRKQLKSEYKSKPVIGAIYSIECGNANRRIIRSTPDIAGIKNRYQFALSTGSCPDPSLRNEWAKHGSEAFSLVVLEELKMNSEQTPKEFADDLKLLLEMWLEKLSTDTTI